MRRTAWLVLNPADPELWHALLAPDTRRARALRKSFVGKKLWKKKKFSRKLGNEIPRLWNRGTQILLLVWKASGLCLFKSPLGWLCEMLRMRRFWLFVCAKLLFFHKNVEKGKQWETNQKLFRPHFLNQWFLHKRKGLFPDWKISASFFSTEKHVSLSLPNIKLFNYFWWLSLLLVFFVCLNDISKVESLCLMMKLKSHFSSPMWAFKANFYLHMQIWWWWSQ